MGTNSSKTVQPFPESPDVIRSMNSPPATPLSTQEDASLLPGYIYTSPYQSQNVPNILDPRSPSTIIKRTPIKDAIIPDTPTTSNNNESNKKELLPKKKKKKNKKKKIVVHTDGKSIMKENFMVTPPKMKSIRNIRTEPRNVLIDISNH